MVGAEAPLGRKVLSRWKLLQSRFNLRLLNQQLSSSVAAEDQATPDVTLLTTRALPAAAGKSSRRFPLPVHTRSPPREAAAAPADSHRFPPP